MEALAPQTETDSGRVWENAATRSAILAAARRIAQQNGILDMSLVAVAADAGFAPASVCTYFGSKNELLLGVVADDLATLARAMRGTFENPETHPVNPEAAAVSETHPAAATRNNDRIPASTAEAIARLQQTVANLEQRPVDAWLERRLREFERALSALEGRKSEKDTVEQSIEERFRDLGENVDALEKRLLATAEDTAQRINRSLDACENRLRQLMSETQGESVALGRRLTAVENAAFAAKPEFFPPAAEIIAKPEETAETESFGAPADGASAEPIMAATASAPYLAAARKSAQAAAQTQITRARKKSRHKSETVVYLSMGSLFLFVAMLTAMGFLLRNQALNETPPGAVARVRIPAAAVHPRPLAARDAKSRLGILAQSGNANAELLLGLADLNSERGRNATAAFQWLSRAAARNQPVAEYELGLMYQNGRGVRADETLAFHWFESAALHGNRKAMHSLATCYAEGWGTQADLTQAARWFARAAALGLVNDQFNLGVLYERGMGVPQNLIDAYKWYAIAAAQGDKESQTRIAALAPTLSPDDLAAARDASASFKPDAVLAAANEAPNPAQLR
ncbi:MAG: TetR family transcriptional regulator [Rhizomicrobium sp.]